MLRNVISLLYSRLWLQSLLYVGYVSQSSCTISCTCYHWVVKERNSRIYSALTVASSSPDLNPVDYRAWGILQEKLFKIRITDLDALKQRLRTDGPIWIASSLRQPFVNGVVDISRSATRTRVLNTFFPIHCNNWIQIYRTVEVG